MKKIVFWKVTDDLEHLLIINENLTMKLININQYSEVYSHNVKVIVDSRKTGNKFLDSSTFGTCHLGDSRWRDNLSILHTGHQVKQKKQWYEENSTKKAFQKVTKLDRKWKISGFQTKQNTGSPSVSEKHCQQTLFLPAKLQSMEVDDACISKTNILLTFISGEEKIIYSCNLSDSVTKLERYILFKNSCN